jgi:hypothetical protein
MLLTIFGFLILELSVNDRKFKERFKKSLAKIESALLEGDPAMSNSGYKREQKKVFDAISKMLNEI